MVPSILEGQKYTIFQFIKKNHKNLHHNYCLVLFLLSHTVNDLKLVVDIGNTFTKLAVFHDDEIIDVKVVENPTITNFEAVFNLYPEIKSSILSSVGNQKPELLNFLSEKGNFLDLHHNTPIPFNNKYCSPESLGKDRIAIAAAAVKLYPNTNVLVIDSGTCITYDLITSDGNYLGGGISPGLKMRFEALHNFTHRLPLIEIPECSTKIELLGNTTESSILSGVIIGLKGEIEYTINQYEMSFSPLKTVISGGDYKYFDKLLKSNIFATPNIVVRGLKNILDFNEKN
jgi:type III pantothenate kinase